MEAALRALPEEVRRIALRPWLFRVAHNESITIVRRRTAVIDPAALPELPSPDGDPQAEPRERLRQLIVDLEALPDRQRGALVMRELSGLGYSEIGHALGSSEAAARQIVYEARLGLREVARGRDLDCDAVRRTLSERDGRTLRGRLLRAHLRACDPCRDFRAAIRERRADLRALCPPLPAATVSGLFAALLDGSAKSGFGTAGPAATGAAGAGLGAGGGAGLTSTSIGSSVALKAASIAAAVTIGAGATGITGKVGLPLRGSGDTPATAHSSLGPATRTAPRPARHVPAHSGQRSDVAPVGASDPNRHAGGRGHAYPRGNAGAAGPGASPAQTAGHGQEARQSAGKSPPGPPPWAGGSSNGSSASGGGPTHSSAHSGSPPGREVAASHVPTLPPQAHGSPGSPPRAQGRPPGKGPQSR
ncbi:MAG: hypothetical protein AUG48_05280 [Actinobacteria bacterium 13_1_20CM_3_68_9]|nr:MAG: hypothetical protein AUG48_05280 [Actinobacteria bacterium 13_1_20CM_3_68_9]